MMVFLEPLDLSRKIGVSIVTLANWRVLKKGPSWYRFGRSIKYSVEDVEDWITMQRRGYGDKKERDELGVPFSVARTRRKRKYRLGGYRTKSEDSSTIGSGSSSETSGGEARDTHSTDSSNGESDRGIPNS